MQSGVVFLRPLGFYFVVLCLGMEREQAFLALEQVRRAVSLRAIKTPQGQAVGQLAISGGVAAFPVDGRTHTELLTKYGVNDIES